MSRTVSPSAKWGEKDVRQQDIRDAARRLLEQEGLAGLNMRSVAQHAGVAPGTVYTYFASKEALFADLYAERLEQLALDITTRCAHVDTVAEVFRTVTDLYLDVYRIFGRELNAWSGLAGFTESSAAATPLDAPTSRLVDAAVAVLGALLHEIDRVDPTLAAALQANDQLGLHLLWVNVGGLAEHFASMRHLLHDSTREQITELGIRVLVAGLDAEL